MVIVDSNTSPTEIEQSGKRIVDELLDKNMSFLVNTYMIPEIQRVAQAANVPKGFIDGIKFVKTDNNEGNIINTWGTKDVPLALWFNYGTKDHGSLGDWPLHWKKAGKNIYAKYVRGVPETKAMEIGISIGEKRLKQEIPKFMESRLE